jgi:hypothetical protein
MRPLLYYFFFTLPHLLRFGLLLRTDGLCFHLLFFSRENGLHRLNSFPCLDLAHGSSLRARAVTAYAFVLL